MKAVLITKFMIFTVIITLIFMVFSCMGIDIKKLSIASVSPEITDIINGTSKTAMVPGQLYGLKVSVITTDGEEITDPDYRNFNVTTPNQSLDILDFQFDKIIIRTKMDVFFLIKNGYYSLHLSIKENSFQGKNYTWYIDWGKYNTLDYSGMQGEEGRDGRDGSDGSDFNEINVDGGDGEDGYDGYPGARGKIVEMLVLFYNVEGMGIENIDDPRMLLFYNMMNKKIYLTKVQNIVINASGGQGGRGGKGGNAGKGGRYTKLNTKTNYNPSDPMASELGFSTSTETVTIEGNAGNPGDGGDGAPGGNGGEIRLLYVEDKILEYITAVVVGGKGGLAGDSGNWITGYKGSQRPGFSGMQGKDGKVGKIFKIRTSIEECTDIFKKDSVADLDFDRLIP
ncbi:MAG: hypothetical protein JW969_07735 [Spirochaetales bacterium]|nr:hypothetical protein [Spirochaetales bacterium]